MQPISQVVSTDDALLLLASQRRRRVLQALRDQGGSWVSIDDLVDELDEGDRSTNLRTTEDGTRIQIELTHTHLPRLEDHGVVTVDQSASTVAQGPAFDAVEPVLRILQQHADDLPTDYLPETADGYRGTDRDAR